VKGGNCRTAMKRPFLFPVIIFLFILGLVLPVTAQAPPSPTPSPLGAIEAVIPPGKPRPVYRIKLDGIVLPPMASYITRGIAQAEAAGAICLIQMDTPGGMMDSMDEIIKAISNTSVPTVVYVAPDGAEASSAGTYIAMAASVIAMAPKTTIGSAHPIITGQERRFKKWEEEQKKDPDIPTPPTAPGKPADDEKERKDRNPFGDFLPWPASEEETIGMEKATNAAVSRIRSLAEEHGRNTRWAEKAVRESVNATAREALKLHVVEVVANDYRDLMDQLEGRKVKVKGKEMILLPLPGEPVDIKMSTTEHFFLAITHPGVAAWFLIIAFMGIAYELKAPGTIIPGVVGGICLILGLYSMGQLPINWAGLAMIFLGLIFFLAELKIHTFGALTLGGVISVILGAMMLVPAGYPYLAVSKGMAVSMGLSMGLFFGVILALIVRSYHRRVETGEEAVVGSLGEARSELVPGGDGGLVFVMGELWKAKPAGNETIAKGTRVRVVRLDGLRVEVEPYREEKGK